MDKMLSETMEAYQNLIFTIVSGILGQNRVCDCEECTADVFVTFWQNQADFNPELCSLKNYLVMLARRKAIDRLRKISVREADALIDELLIFSDSSDVSESVLERINKDIISEVINSLDSPDREIFTMRYYYCMRVKTIASVLKKKPKFIEDRLYRTKDEIKKRLIQKNINI